VSREEQRRHRTRLVDATDVELLGHLRARAGIEDLVHAYARLVDLNRPVDIAALFTAECWVDFGPGAPTGAPMRTRAEVAERLAHGLSIFVATSHHVSNLEVEVDPDAGRAAGSCYVYAWHRFADDRPDADVWGRYHDEYVRDAGTWYIARRELRVAGEQGFPIEFTPIGRTPSAG